MRFRPFARNSRALRLASIFLGGWGRQRRPIALLIGRIFIYQRKHSAAAADFNIVGMSPETKDTFAVLFRGRAITTIQGFVGAIRRKRILDAFSASFIGAQHLQVNIRILPIIAAFESGKN